MKKNKKLIILKKFKKLFNIIKINSYILKIKFYLPV